MQGIMVFSLLKVTIWINNFSLEYIVAKTGALQELFSYYSYLEVKSKKPVKNSIILDILLSCQALFIYFSDPFFKEFHYLMLKNKFNWML